MPEPNEQQKLFEPIVSTYMAAMGLTINIQNYLHGGMSDAQMEEAISDFQNAMISTHGGADRCAAALVAFGKTIGVGVAIAQVPNVPPERMN